jgi:methylase of polypeptide subunit release factors
MFTIFFIFMSAEFWDSRFDPQKEFAYGKEPNDFIAQNAHLIPKQSRILALGEGQGRNAIFLAKQGHSVHCIDLSPVGLQTVEKWAKDIGVTTITTQVLQS